MNDAIENNDQHEPSDNDGVSSFRLRLDDSALSPAAEGRIYLEWTQQINPQTGQRFKLHEIARITGRPYGQIRNRASLVRSYDPNADVPYERIGEVDLSQSSFYRYFKEGMTWR